MGLGKGNLRSVPALHPGVVLSDSLPVVTALEASSKLIPRQTCRKQLNSAVEVAIFDSEVLAASSHVETTGPGVETVLVSEGAGNAFGLGTVGASSEAGGGIGASVVAGGVAVAAVVGVGAVVEVETGAVECVLGQAAQKRAANSVTNKIVRFKLFSCLSELVSEPVAPAFLRD